MSVEMLLVVFLNIFAAMLKLYRKTSFRLPRKIKKLWKKSNNFYDLKANAYIAYLRKSLSKRMFNYNNFGSDERDILLHWFGY